MPEQWRDYTQQGERISAGYLGVGATSLDFMMPDQRLDACGALRERFVSRYSFPIASAYRCTSSALRLRGFSWPRATFLASCLTVSL